jgi:hypothetical protein
MDVIFSSVRNMGVLIAVGVLGIIAAVFLIRALASIRRARASRAWPSITGTILSSNVVAGRRPGRNGVSYHPSVMYEYHVNGQRYMGNRISFGAQVGTGISSWAQNKLAQYPVGASVAVHYNPLNPADAVLESGAAASWSMFLIPAILIVAMIVFLVSFGVIKLPFGR